MPCRPRCCLLKCSILHVMGALTGPTRTTRHAAAPSSAGSVKEGCRRHTATLSTIQNTQRHDLQLQVAA